MTKEQFLNSKQAKLLLAFVGFLIVIYIARSGYEAGRWLYQMLHI